MPRTNRIDVGDTVYHIINRANARMKIFDTDEDYLLFEVKGEVKGVRSAP